MRPEFRDMLNLIWGSAPAYVKARLGWAASLVLLAAMLTALIPVLLKLVIDLLADGNPRQDVSLGVLLALLILSHWIARLLGEIRTYASMQADRRMCRHLTNAIFEHALALPLRYHLNRETGTLTEIMKNGVYGFQLISQSVMSVLIPVIVEGATVLVVFVALGQVDFLAIFLLAMICYGTAFHIGAGRIMSRALDASSTQATAWGAITDCILNYEVIKLFGAEPMAGGRVNSSLEQTEAGWTRFNLTRMRIGFVVHSIFASFLALTVLYAANRVQASAITLGSFVLINTYMLSLALLLERIGHASNLVAQGIAYLKAFLGVLAERSEKVEPARGTPPRRHVGEVQFENVSLHYRSGTPAIRNLSLCIPAGATWAVVGSSGSGKSTLIRLLTRMLDPDEGRILLDGRSLQDLPLAHLRGLVAVVPQDTVLFNASIASNIALGRAGSTREDVEQAARLAHLHEFILGLPEGYETSVGERGVQLSGGERQRIAIARAAIRRPLVYIFDEATSSLDSRTEREVLENLRELSAYRTTLLIAHRLSTVVHADQILVLEHGTIVEQGTHVELMTREGHYARLWETQHPLHLVRPAAGSSSR